jgi:hypothetical protein
MNNSITSLIFVLALFIFTGCKTTSVTPLSKTQNKEKTEVLEKINANLLDYEWIEVRSKLKYKGEKNSISATGIFRMRKDSLIWGVFKKASIEGVRFKITPEKAEFLNRQKNEYIVVPFDSIKQRLGMKFSFSDLQHMLLGEPVLMQEKELIYKKEPTYYSLKTAPSSFTFLEYSIAPDNFGLQAFSGAQNGYEVAVTCTEILEVDGHKLPKNKEIIFTNQAEEVTQLKLNFTKVQTKSFLSTRFSVPDSYKTIK